MWFGPSVRVPRPGHFFLPDVYNPSVGTNALKVYVLSPWRYFTLGVKNKMGRGQKVCLNYSF